MLKVLFKMISFLLGGAVLKFIMVMMIYGVVVVLGPVVAAIVASAIDLSGLTSSFASLPSGVWFFVDYFRVDVGLPVVLAACVAKFTIRRIPLVG